MSEVRMSLQEYNDLMKEMASYKFIVDHFFKPEISKYDLGRFKEEEDYGTTLYSEYHLPEEIKEFIEEKILQSAKEEFEKAGMDPSELSFEVSSYFNLGVLSRNLKSEESE